MSNEGTAKAKTKGKRIDAHASAATSRDPRMDAAQSRLRESGGQADALEAIREIVANLLGCEEIAVFAAKNGNSGLLWSFGIDVQKYATLDSFQESALPLVLRGELHIAQAKNNEPGGDPTLRAFIPILKDGRTVAVLVMLKLLPQKCGLDEADINLLHFLSTEVGRTLFDRSESTNA